MDIYGVRVCTKGCNHMMRELDVYEEEEPVSFRKEIKPMTRAEWVKQARIECEKELEYYEEFRQQAQAYLEKEEAMEEEVERERQIEEAENQEYQGYIQQESMEVRDDVIKIKEQLEDGQSVRKEMISLPLSYLSNFTVRLITAVLIALFVITIDYFGIKASGVDSEVVKTAIQKNDTIESVEDSVSAFARDKVMPIFKKSH